LPSTSLMRVLATVTPRNPVLTMTLHSSIFSRPFHVTIAGNEPSVEIESL